MIVFSGWVISNKLPSISSFESVFIFYILGRTRSFLNYCELFNLFCVFSPQLTIICRLTERRGDLVVSVSDSWSRGPGSSPGRVIALCSWARHFILTVPLSTQEYKWVPANCQRNLTKCWGGGGGVTCDGLASHPGGVAIFLVASCYGNRDKLRLCGPLGSCADFTFWT